MTGAPTPPTYPTTVTFPNKRLASITPDHITYTFSLVGDHSRRVPLRSIASLQATQTPIHRALRVWTLKIRMRAAQSNAQEDGQGPVITVRGVRDPAAIFTAISQHRDNPPRTGALP